MARLPRILWPGQAHLVEQRGHNGVSIVRDERDSRDWRALLQDAAVTERVDLHAWALLEDRFLLLVSPHTPEGLSRLMQSLARRYAVAFNRRHGRRGTLWEGRFRACVLEPGAWVLEGMAHVEQGGQAVAAQHPPDTLRCSSPHHLGQVRDPGLTEPPAWWSLGNTPFERELAWQARLAQATTADRAYRIASSLRRGWPLGEREFLKVMAQRTGRSATPLPRGRPRRVPPRSAAS